MVALLLHHGTVLVRTSNMVTSNQLFLNVVRLHRSCNLGILLNLAPEFLTDSLLFLVHWYRYRFLLLLLLLLNTVDRGKKLGQEGEESEVFC
jgi:hypothetical protein